MNQNAWKALNWADYRDMQTFLESYGFAVMHDESEDDLRQAIAANVEDGTIDVNDLLATFE